MRAPRPSFRNFARASQGATAVEFAFTFPILLTLLFGMSEVGQLVTTQHRLDNAGASVCDVIGQRSVLGTSDETNIFTAAADIMGSAASTAPALRVSQIVITNTNIPKYEWSDVQGAAFTAYTRCATANIARLRGPNAPALAAGARVLVTEIQYSWRSPFSYVLKTPLTLKSMMIESPRKQSVTRDWGNGTTSATLTPCTGS